ncbi:MAG: insulinase family protein [Planctomycetes bacterium]|nr:insulinase family protein [Planctomycetota bacterium]
MRLWTVGLTLAALSAVCAPSEARDLRLPVQEKVLDNGLKVLVLEDHSIPNATLYVAWKVGSRNERPGITGIAHFFEHMMFSGGAKYGKAFDATMERNGGSNNAYTTRDVTVYTDWFPAAKLPLILDMEADRMRGMNFDPKVVASEREVVASERRLNMEEPASVLAEQLWAAAYTAHPYQWDVLGWMVDIQHWKQEDLEAFFAAHYAPNNAVVVIVGAVEAERVFALVEEAMGAIPRGPERRPIHTREPRQEGERRLVVEDENANLSQVMCAWHIPETAHPDFPAIDVAERILLAGESSRLYRKLVDEDELCLQVGGGWQGYQFDPSLFTLELVIREGQDPAQAERVAYAELQRMAEEGPSAAELEKAKRQLVVGLVRQLETLDGKAGLIADTELFFGGWRKLQARVDAIEAVDAAAVQRVLATYFRPRNRTVATLVPTAAEEEAEAPPAERSLPEEPAEAPPAAAVEPVKRPQAPAGEPKIALPDAEFMALDSGVQVLLVPDPEVPLVSFYLRLDGGALLDPEGAEGASSLLATLLERGAGARDALAFQEAVDRVGGRLAVRSRKRWIEVEAQFLREDAALAVSLLADLLIRPRLDAGEFSKARGLALDELKAARDEPAQLIDDYWNAWSKRGHPFARATSGDQGSVASLTLEQLRALAKRQLVPQRAMLAVAGDFAQPAMLDLLASQLGAWKGSWEAGPELPPLKPLPGGQVLLVDAPDALQTYFYAGNVLFDWSDPDYAARYLANTILGGRFTSRLNMALRTESGLTYGASSWIDDTLGGMFALSSYTATPTSAEAIELARATYARFRERGIDAAELESARTYIKGQYAPDTLETAMQRAKLLLALAYAGVPRARIAGLFEALDALKLEDVNRVIKRFPEPKALRWVVLGQAKQLRELAAGLGEVTEVELAAPGFGPK